MALISDYTESEIKLWLDTFFATLAAQVMGGTAGLQARRLFTTGRAIGQADDISAATATFNQAYIAGKAAGVLGTNTVRKMTQPQLLSAIENSPAVLSLGPADQEVLSLLERNSARTIARRAAVHESKIQEILSVANTRWTGAVQGGMGPAEAAAARHSLLSELGQQVGFQLIGAGSDSKRFMQTELANYFQRGQVQDKNPEMEVWKIPRDTAEAQCLRIYLNRDGSPRRYLLRDVLGNSNVGLPPEQWRFVIGATHPYCYCILFEEELTRRPGPNKKLADRREEMVTGGRVIPTGPRSQAARRGRSVLPRGTTRAVRVGDRVYPLGHRLDPGPVRRARAAVRGAPPTATDIPQKYETISQKIERRLSAKPKAKQNTADVDELYRAAKVADPQLQSLVRELAEDLNGEALFPPGLKKRATAITKAQTKYKGDFAALTDLSRASLQFDKLDDVYGALAAIEKRTGIKIARMNDRFLRPTAEGYRDIIMNLRMPNGHLVELQLHVKQIAKAKDKAHLFYERRRRITQRAEFAKRDLTLSEFKKVQALTAKQQQIYGKAFAEATVDIAPRVLKPVRAPARAPAKVPAKAPPKPPQVSKDIPDEFAAISQKVEKKLAAKPKAKQDTDDLDALYKSAAQADPVLQKTVRELADDLGGEAMFPPGLKGRERAVEKVMAKYGGDFAALTDLSRATLAFDKLEDVYGALAQLEKRGLKIVRLNDRFLRPTAEGYRDIITNVRMPNGHVAELQLHVKGITKAKDASHALYEQQRTILAKAKTAGRDLTKAEMTTVRGLVEQQQVAYGRAFAEATAVKPKVGIPKAAAPAKFKPNTVKPVEPDDILKVQGSDPRMVARAEKKIAKKQAAAWNEMAEGKISMTEFFEQSMKGTGATLERFEFRTLSAAERVKLNLGDEPFFGYKARIKIGDTQIPAKLTRNFVKRGGQWEIDHELLEIGWAGQGTGLAKKILKNDLELYQKMGIKAVNLEAGLEIGGYAWARYGFVPQAAEWVKVKSVILERSKLIMKDLSPTNRTILKQALASRDPKAIWKIADMRTPVKKFDPKALDPTGHYPAVKPGDEPLGSFLLREQNWKGTLNLADETAVSRTMNYIGA